MLYNNAGGPTNPNSFAEFRNVITDCGDVTALAAGNVDGVVISVDQELPTTFNSSGATASEGNPGTGTIKADPGVFANIQQYGVNWIRETCAFRGQQGDIMQFSAYSKSSNYSDTDRQVTS